MSDDIRLDANSMADCLLRLASRLRMLADAKLASQLDLRQLQYCLRELDETTMNLVSEVPAETRRQYSELARPYMEILALVALGMFAEHADCPHATSPSIKVVVRDNRLWLKCDQGCEWEWAPLRPK